MSKINPKTGNDILDLNDQDFVKKILSYYIYGQENPPKPEELKNTKYINRKDTITLDVDIHDFLKTTGLGKTGAYQFTTIRRFFKNDRENSINFSTFRERVDSMVYKEINDKGENIGLSHQDIEKRADGTYAITFKAFRYFFYKEAPAINKEAGFNKSKEPESPYYFYRDKIYNDENLSKNAFAFGSVNLTYDTD